MRAVAQVNGVRLRIVGDGPERASLEQLAVGLGLTDRVEFAGMVSAAALPGELSRLHVGTAPYPTPEGYFSPMKVFEYLPRGCRSWQAARAAARHHHRRRGGPAHPGR